MGYLTLCSRVITFNNSSLLKVSLVCLSTNETSHERFFRFPRRAMFGTALPSWLLSPGTLLLRRFVRNKSDPLCDIVDLVEAN